MVGGKNWPLHTTLKISLWALSYEQQEEEEETRAPVFIDLGARLNSQKVKVLAEIYKCIPFPRAFAITPIH